MDRRKRLPVLILVLILAFSLSACGGGRTVRSVSVCNRTGTTICDLRLMPESADGWGDNQLNEPLPPDETVSVGLGRLRDDEQNGGVRIQLIDAVGEVIGEVHSVTLTGEGSLTLYLDVTGALLASADGFDPGSDPESVLRTFAGVWDSYDTYGAGYGYLSIDYDGTWTLFNTAEEITAFGWLEYDREQNAVLSYEHDGKTVSGIRLEGDDTLTVDLYGVFCRSATRSLDTNSGNSIPGDEERGPDIPYTGPATVLRIGDAGFDMTPLAGEWYPDGNRKKALSYLAFGTDGVWYRYDRGSTREEFTLTLWGDMGMDPSDPHRYYAFAADGGPVCDNITLYDDGHLAYGLDGQSFERLD